MTRLLLDYATGLHSGSLYNDTSLWPVLPGEAECPINTLTVKSHLYLYAPPGTAGAAGASPANASLEPLRSVFINGRPWAVKREKVARCRGANKLWADSCGELGPSGARRPPRALAAIVVFRNPFEAIWSEVQRRVAARRAQRQHKVEGAQHTMALTPASIGKDFIRSNAADALRALVRNWQWYEIMVAHDDMRVHFVDYYDLLDKRARGTALVGMLNQLVTGPDGGHVAVAPSLLECAFAYAEQAHRLGPNSASHAATPGGIGDATAGGGGGGGGGDGAGGAKGAALREAFPPALAQKLWDTGMSKAWDIAKRLGLPWHLSLGEVEKTFLPADVSAQFLPARRSD